MAEPITIEEARAQCRLGDDTSQDTTLQGLISAARQWVENYTGLILVSTQVTEALNGLCAVQRLQSWPIAANAVPVVKYLDSGGAQQTLTGSRLLVGHRPARLMAGLGTAWPTIYSVAESVTVTVQAGYATPDDVPAVLKRAMLIHIEAMFDHSALDSSERAALESLCFPYVRITA